MYVHGPILKVRGLSIEPHFSTVCIDLSMHYNSFFKLVCSPNIYACKGAFNPNISNISAKFRRGFALQCFFIVIIFKYKLSFLYFYIIYHLLLLSPFFQKLVLSSWLLVNILARLVLHLQFSFLREEGKMAVALEEILLAWRLVLIFYASLSLVSVP